MVTLAVSAEVSTPGGGWLLLEDEENGLGLHTDTYAERTQTRRTKTADGQWIGGSFGLRSVPESVEETVGVWVDGIDSQWTFRERMQAVQECFDQMRYTVRFTVGDMRETWTCVVPAEYSIATEQAFLVATTGLIKAKVLRLPKVTREHLTP